jgi:hypothetical protein
MKRISLFFVLALALCAVATANIIPTWNSTTPSGSVFLWSYNFDLSADQNAGVGPAPSVNPTASDSLVGGSYLTIMDFAGYVDGSCTGPAGWACTVQNVGYTPDSVLPTDNAGIVNITWAHTTGSTILGAPDGVDLGTFTAQSTIGIPKVGVNYVSRGIGTASGLIANNVGFTSAPDPVPEPVTMALIGSGLVVLGVLRRRARKN